MFMPNRIILCYVIFVVSSETSQVTYAAMILHNNVPFKMATSLKGKNLERIISHIV